MELINQLSWSACFEQRGNQQRRGFGELLLEGGECAVGVGLGERWGRECAPRQHGWHGQDWGGDEGTSAGGQFVWFALLQCVGFWAPSHPSHSPKAFPKGRRGRRGAGYVLALRRNSVVAGKGAGQSPFLFMAPAIWQAPTLEEKTTPAACWPGWLYPAR